MNKEEMTISEKALEIVLKMEQDFNKLTSRLIEKTPEIIKELTVEQITEGCQNKSRNKIEEKRRKTGQRVYCSILAKWISSTPYMKYTSEHGTLGDEVFDYVNTYGKGFNTTELCDEVYDLYAKRFSENSKNILNNE